MNPTQKLPTSITFLSPLVTHLSLDRVSQSIQSPQESPSSDYEYDFYNPHHDNVQPTTGILSSVVHSTSLSNQEAKRRREAESPASPRPRAMSPLKLPESEDPREITSWSFSLTMHPNSEYPKTKKIVREILSQTQRTSAQSEILPPEEQDPEEGFIFRIEL